MSGDSRAGRIRRLLALAIDFVVIAVIAFAAMWPLGIFEHEQAYERGQFVFRLFALILGTYALVNGWLLHKRGQTVGKRLLRIRAVRDSDGGPLALWVQLARIFWIFALTTLPALYWSPRSALMFFGVVLAIDGLFIFTRQRRCLHDFMVGSQVEKAAKN